MAEGGEVGRREEWDMEIGTPLPLCSRNTQGRSYHNTSSHVLFLQPGARCCAKCFIRSKSLTFALLVG